MTPTAIRIGGKIKTLWEVPIGDHTIGAYQIANPERTSSSVGIAEAFLRAADAARADNNLSDQGKRQKINGYAESYFGNLKTHIETLKTMRSELQDRKRNAVRIPEASVIDALHDIEIGRMIRAENKTETLLVMTASERTKLAAARLPTEISGLTNDVRTLIQGSFVSPGLGLELQERELAIESAHQVTQAAINAIAPNIDSMKLIEKQAFVGAEFKV